MEPQEINNLISKYKEGVASQAEIDALHNWYWEIGYADGIYPDDEVLVKARIQNRLAASISPVKKYKLWPRIAVVAAAVAAVVFGVWFYNAHNMVGHQLGGRHPELVSGPQDITPGKNTATLTLPNGKTITLSDAKTGVVINANSLKYNDGSLLKYQKNTGPVGVHSLGTNEMLTASTPRGGTYQFTLPDGTQVWLNAASSLKFPLQFSGVTRKILLNGEAYFEVSKNKAKPFIVASNGQEVTVLGTHFNINAYADESSTKTTLLEGSVKVSHHDGQDHGKGYGQDVVLKPNQQASLTQGMNIAVKEVNAQEFTAWKDGLFTYKNTPLETVMKQISRWYNVDVQYQRVDLKNRTFSGSLSRDNNIHRILSAIEFAGDVQFKIEGKKITVNAFNK